MCQYKYPLDIGELSQDVIRKLNEKNAPPKNSKILSSYIDALNASNSENTDDLVGVLP